MNLKFCPILLGRTSNQLSQFRKQKLQHGGPVRLPVAEDQIDSCAVTECHFDKLFNINVRGALFPGAKGFTATEGPRLDYSQRLCCEC